MLSTFTVTRTVKVGKPWRSRCRHCERANRLVTRYRSHGTMDGEKSIFETVLCAECKGNPRNGY